MAFTRLGDENNVSIGLESVWVPTAAIIRYIHQFTRITMTTSMIRMAFCIVVSIHCICRFLPWCFQVTQLFLASTIWFREYFAYGCWRNLKSSETSFLCFISRLLSYLINSNYWFVCYFSKSILKDLYLTTVSPQIILLINFLPDIRAGTQLALLPLIRVTSILNSIQYTYGFSF